MQTDSAVFTASQNGIRYPTFRVSCAIDKTIDPAIDYLTYDNSEDYDSGLTYRYESGDVLQEFDQYIYTDFSSRVLSVNVEREKLRPSSVCMAYADIVLDNTDGAFNSDGIYGTYILPARPFKIAMGFNNNNVPKFVGLSVGMPDIDEKNKTVSFHCQDFLGLLLARPVEQTVLLENQRVDQILGLLFEEVGLLPTQYVFDVAVLSVPFSFVQRGDNLFTVAEKLIGSEIGTLLMDERGMVRFSNRESLDETVQMEFSTATNIFDYVRRRDTDLINKVQVKSDVRKVGVLQRYWESTEIKPIQPGETIEVWANFSDPVTDIDEPGINNQFSSFRSNDSADGKGVDGSDIVLDSATAFGTSYLMEFTNTGGSLRWLADLVLYCEPAKVTHQLFIEQENTSSIDLYGQNILTVENDYFSSESDAENFAKRILLEYATPSVIAEIDVHGTPQLQLGDVCTVSIYGVSDDVTLVRIADKIEKNRYTQTLRFKDFPDLPFFLYDNSQDYDDGNIYKI